MSDADEIRDFIDRGRAAQEAVNDLGARTPRAQLSDQLGQALAVGWDDADRAVLTLVHLVRNLLTRQGATVEFVRDRDSEPLTALRVEYGNFNPVVVTVSLP